MDVDKIIQKGDWAKYQIVIEHADFDQQTDDFFVVLHYGMMGGQVTVERKDMPHDEDGNFFVLFDSTDMMGRVKAETHYMVPDSDIEGGVREEVEWDWLGFVTDNPQPRLQCCPCKDEEQKGSHVTFTRVWRGDVNTLYLNVRTKDKEPVIGADGKQIRVRKEDKDIY